MLLNVVRAAQVDKKSGFLSCPDSTLKMLCTVVCLVLVLVWLVGEFFVCCCCFLLKNKGIA